MAETGTRESFVRPLAVHTPLHWVAVALAAASGLIHVYLGIVEGIPPFVVAGVGFFLGIAVFLTRFWRRLFYPVAAVFAFVQIALWLAGGLRFFTLGVVDKVVQAAFVVVVLYLYRAGE